jgi:hypothetical protein
MVKFSFLAGVVQASEAPAPVTLPRFDPFAASQRLDQALRAVDGEPRR